MKTERFILDLDELDDVLNTDGWGAFDTAVRVAITPAVDFVCEDPRWSDVHGSLVWMVRELAVNACGALRRHSNTVPSTAGVELSVLAGMDRESGSFEILIRNSGLPSEKDRYEIERRLTHYEKTRAEIEALRKKHTKPNGRVCIPSTAGGGGLAILECIRWTREKGFHFSFHTQNDPPMTVFRIGNRPSQKG